MALYVGQGVGQVTQVVPAAQVMTELAEGPIGCRAAGAPVQAPDSARTQCSRGRGLAGALAPLANALFVLQFVSQTKVGTFDTHG
jgi:hypothetical protein